MGVIKQLKQFITGTHIFPVTKTNAVYDDQLGRLDSILRLPKDAETLGGNPPNYYLNTREKNPDIDGTLANLISKGSGSGDKVNFTEVSAPSVLVSGESLPTLFGKVAKVVTDFISHIAQNGNTSTFGHIKLSDTYASAAQNNKAKDGLGASQYALYSAYYSLTSDSNITMKAKGNKSTATLDFLDIGIFRIAGLTASNSPSTSDTEGILINASAMNMVTTAMSATFQIFFGKTSQTVYARLQMGDSWTNAWIKLSA